MVISDYLVFTFPYKRYTALIQGKMDTNVSGNQREIIGFSFKMIFFNIQRYLSTNRKIARYIFPNK